ncbi:MAG TPA: SOS response-associated peptidase [Burkholderiales bacterium]|nr:SOS response-associated peptidase [Burkholderiales bacterium]
MCGRYDLNTPPIRLKTRFQTDFGHLAQELGPHYNIAPSMRVPVIRIQDGQRCAAMTTWGLVPHWAKNVSGVNPINARGESLAEKPMFRDAFKWRRCLIPADGFYEWKRSAAGKQPWRFTMADKEPFAMAGIWEEWRKQGEKRQTCAIITIGANELMAPIHDRMPVIIPFERYARWLDLADESVFDLLVPYPAEEMVAYPVSTRVNTPKNDDPALIEPLDC